MNKPRRRLCSRAHVGRGHDHDHDHDHDARYYFAADRPAPAMQLVALDRCLPAFVSKLLIFTRRCTNFSYESGKKYQQKPADARQKEAFAHEKHPTPGSPFDGASHRRCRGRRHCRCRSVGPDRRQWVPLLACRAEG